MSKKNNLSSLETYFNGVFKSIMLIIPLFGLCAGATFSIIKACGLYDNVEWSSFMILNLFDVLYCFAGIFCVYRISKSTETYYSKIFRNGKIIACFIFVLQWNLISYIIPSRDFWAYIFFFVTISLLFLDSKMVLFSSVSLLISTIISWFIRPNELLPVKDELFIPELILRCVVLFLGLGTLWFVSFLVEKYLASELEKMADVDILTLLYNRRKLTSSLNSAIENKKNKGEEFSIMMIDIDDFKITNDTYGHACGDEVLKGIARILTNTIRENGMVFRYGGEEMLVLIYANAELAMKTAETIRNKINTEKIEYKGNSIVSSVTIGVASCNIDDNDSSIIARADSNLYYGKNHGKNCVVN